MVLKFKSKLNSKFILNGSKTIKIMKGSKNTKNTNLFLVRRISKQLLWKVFVAVAIS